MLTQRTPAATSLAKPTAASIAVQAYGEDAHLRLHTALDERAATALQDFTDFLHRWGFIPERFAVRDWIDPRPLDALRSAVAKRAS